MKSKATNSCKLKKQPDTQNLDADCLSNEDVFDNPLQDRRVEGTSNLPLGIPLSDIVPITCYFRPSEGTMPWTIRRPLPDEPFSVAGPHLRTPCYVEPIGYGDGLPAGELYCPVTPEMRERHDLPTKLVSFDACESQYHGPFIFPRVIERRSSAVSARDASLQTALDQARDAWVTLEFNPEEDIYEYEHTALAENEDIRYPGFTVSCLTNIGYCFLSVEEHPLHCLIREQAVLQGATG